MKKARVFFLTIAIFFSSCSDGYGFEGRLGYAEDFFSKNKDGLNDVVRLLLSHPSIKRVEGLKFKYIPKYGDFDDADIAVYKKINDFIELNGVRAVSVARKDQRLDGFLIGITFILKSEGTIRDRYMLSIVYINDDGYIEKAKGHGIKHYYLGTSKWYIAELLL